LAAGFLGARNPIWAPARGSTRSSRSARPLTRRDPIALAVTLRAARHRPVAIAALCPPPPAPIPTRRPHPSQFATGPPAGCLTPRWFFTTRALGQPTLRVAQIHSA